MQPIDFGGAHRQRAVHIDRDVGNLAALEKIVQHEQQLLRALHREGGNQDLAAAMDRLPDDLREM